MNFLAHAYLSFNDPEILIGNMIADLVKGKQIEEYPERVKEGIRLHRKIDSFTDKHPVTIQTMEVFKPSVGRYAGAFLDVAYDHFLALSPIYEPAEGWENFSEKCYSQISLFGEIFPPHFSSIFFYMKRENWLYNYRNTWLIKRSFKRLKQRAIYLKNSAPVFADFEHHYDEIKKSFDLFFPELRSYVKEVANAEIRNTVSL